MRRSVLLGLALVSGGCSLALDFDDESDLHCPCLPDYVCLQTSDRCVKKGSVEDFKSCSPDAVTPDDLCAENRICYAINSQGPRCLPRCTPSSYSTPEAGLSIAAQCQSGKTCWPVPEGGGVCSEGICTDLPNTCGPPQTCVVFNAAGVCFTPCRIFNADACAGDQACHPIGDSSATACIQSGTKLLGEICDDKNPCVKRDSVNRRLVCDRPQGSTDSRRCYATCQYPSNIGCGPAETCLFSRPRIDPDTQADLGLCVGT
ncbi:MAG: hypothetical protein IT384_11990 [Deltaproteobacteria bacterium]|nr:hypothetical protein [Deltaproteobacteria bacterium]